MFFSTKSLICSPVAATNFFGDVFALEFDTWEHRLKQHMTRGSRVHGDSDFDPSVLDVNDFLWTRIVTVLHTQK